MEITITLNASPAFLNAINRLADALTPLATTTPKPAAEMPGVTDPKPTQKPPVANVLDFEQPTGSNKEPEEVPDRASDVPQEEACEIMPLEDFRKAVGEKARRNKDAVSRILNAHGYSKVPEVKPEERQKIVLELEAV